MDNESPRGEKPVFVLYKFADPEHPTDEELDEFMQALVGSTRTAMSTRASRSPQIVDHVWTED